LGFFGSF